MVKKILIVEDNELNMKLFNDLLKAFGYETLMSIDGSDALQIAHDNHPDLVIMDIQLPGRSGLDLSKDMKSAEDLKDIPIIAATAFAMKGDEEKILAAGCDAYLSKPISVSNFIETINKLLD